MPSGYKVNGVDLDDIFEPYSTGTKAAPTGYAVAGQDLRDRYAPLYLGSAAGPTGHTVQGADLNTIFAAKGSVSSPIAGFNGKQLVAGDAALTGQQWVTAQAGFALNSDGSWTVFGGGSKGPQPQDPPTSGTWLVYGGTAADYEALFEFTVAGASADEQINNGAPTWTSLHQSRGGSITLPQAPGANADYREAAYTVRVRIRRKSTGAVVSDNSVGIRVSTMGYA